MARLKRARERVKVIAPRTRHYPGFPYFPKPDGWKPPQQIRLEILTAKYRKKYAEGKGWSNADLIYVYHRNNMTIEETAAILDETAETIRQALDTIRQNAD
ncbi:hypothetical protein J5I95_19435 [Candidatus Poribacteria bacterium]|nr:hypothetical protein [Candidatus Poribacteria bacterium]